MRASCTREVELDLCGGGKIVAGMDEVGRGSLAGPVAVGVAVVDTRCGAPPRGLADSKRLTARARTRLCAPIEAWALASAVGYASPAEIDAFGIVGALALAGRRALAGAARRGPAPDAVLLDGSYDYMGRCDLGALGAASAARADVAVPPVVVRVRADATCACVAAAAVLAKVSRDALMSAHPDPGYGWAANKGYATPAHARALRRLGPSAWHRRSWHLPGIGPVSPGRGAAVVERA